MSIHRSREFRERVTSRTFMAHGIEKGGVVLNKRETSTYGTFDVPL